MYFDTSEIEQAMTNESKKLYKQAEHHQPITRHRIQTHKQKDNKYLISRLIRPIKAFHLKNIVWVFDKS